MENSSRGGIPGQRIVEHRLHMADNANVIKDVRYHIIGNEHEVTQ